MHPLPCLHSSRAAGSVASGSHSNSNGGGRVFVTNAATPNACPRCETLIFKPEEVRRMRALVRV